MIEAVNVVEKRTSDEIEMGNKKDNLSYLPPFIDPIELIAPAQKKIKKAVAVPTPRDINQSLSKFVSTEICWILLMKLVGLL